MSDLADEKKAFKITGKFSGGVGSSGTWNTVGGGRHGNDWEAQERALMGAPRPSAISKRPKRGDFADTVKIPGKAATPMSKAKEEVKKKVKESSSKAKSILTPRAKSEGERLENLFSGGISHPAQLIPAARAASGMAGIVKDIMKRK